MEICDQNRFPRERLPSVVEVKNKIRLHHNECCNCCCCKSPEFKAYRYIQPERTKSFKPLRCFYKSEAPLEDQTTYRLSFWPGPRVVTKPILPEGNLTVADGCKFSHDTTHNMSYLGNWCVKPQEKISPCSRDLFGHGPMQCGTTQKRDYSWKSGLKEKPIKYTGNICVPKGCLEDNTTYKLSYFPSNCLNRVESYKPVRTYEKNDAPVEDCTTYRLSFWPSEPHKQESYPWKEKLKYVEPTTPVDGCTTYKLSYWPQCPERVAPIRHHDDDNLLSKGPCFDDNTTYGLSFFGGQGERPEQVRPEGNIIFEPCPITHDTVNRMSYVGNWCPKPAEPVKPCERQLLGRGPIEDCTVQKCSYTWKSKEPESPFKPVGNLDFSAAPLSCVTTNRLSFMPNCGECLVPNKSYKPIRTYLPNDAPLDTDTVQQLSYQPVQKPEKIEKPWAAKVKYQKPTNEMDDNTTYALSFIPPGKIVPCCPETPPCPPPNCSSVCPQVSAPCATPCASC